MACSLRTMALAVGRGAQLLGSGDLLSTEALLIPPLCLAGTCGEAGQPGQQGATINLDLSSAQPAPGGWEWKGSEPSL